MNHKKFIAAAVLLCLAGLIGATPRATAQQAQPAGADDAADRTTAPQAAAAGSNIDALIAEASAENGEVSAQICGNCHNLSLRGGDKIGPNLFGVADRWIAGLPGYSYSAALTAKAGETWSNENLDAFLANPKEWAPGTKMTFPGLRDERERASIIAYLRSLPIGMDPKSWLPKSRAEAPDIVQPPEVVLPEEEKRLVREGLVVEISATPVRSDGGADRGLMRGDNAEVTFRITEEASGAPVSGLFPGAWMDIGTPWGSERQPEYSCKDRVGLYLQGNVGIRPLIDMNGYFLLSLNEDATITIIDPFVGMSGITRLYGLIKLERPAADWAKTGDDKRFFVSMPRADKVAVVNTDVFKVETNVDAGVHPVRVAVQPDEKYLWVGNDSKEPAESGVTVIDLESLKIVAQIPTGAGHHEIAFTDDNRTAFVSNRKSGTVSVIDIASLEKVEDIETGAVPISIAFSSLSRALYVADGREGAISVIDAESLTVTARIKALPGLGPLRFDPSGRWGLVPNSEQDLVHVIDASANRIAQNVSVGTRPFQVAFSRAFAYVRSLGTERVSMFNLEELNKGRRPPVVSFQAGQKAPELTPELNLADVIVEAPGMAAVLVSSPADATVYYYMEGMNAPMGNFRNYGHRPLAVGVVDRALREKAPGVYSANVQLPEAGTYEVAFMMESPQILHCFGLVARPNPLMQDDAARLAVEYLVEDRRVPAGKELALRFRLTDPRNGQLRSGLKDVRVLSYRAPAFDRKVVWASDLGDGIYEARFPIRRPGAYYVFVSSESAGATYDDLLYLTVMGVHGKAATQTNGQTGG
jgi:YVTN family beta-propeller protein